MEQDFEALKARLNSSSRYLQSNDMRVTELGRGWSRVEMTVDEQILNIHGFVHGGALFSLADTAAGAASFTTGRDSVTLSATINYLSPGRGGRLVAAATEVKAGRTTGVYEVFMYNDRQDLICRATMTVFFLDRNREDRHDHHGKKDHRS